jgi:hypothetical protein
METKDLKMKTDLVCFQQCVEDIEARAPLLFRSSEFAEYLGWKSIHLSSTLKKERGWRGEALWREGIVALDARDVSRFRTATPYSAPGGKADMSPTGVLAHELGHFWWFKRPYDVARRWRSVFGHKDEKPITRYAGTHVGEDFAESFRLWALNPAMLATVAPRRYALIGSLSLTHGFSHMKLEASKQKDQSLKVAITME